VVMCDGDAGKELLAPGGPLARFAPGKLAEVVRLPETGPLEHFAGAAPPISIAAGSRAAGSAIYRCRGHYRSVWQSKSERPAGCRAGRRGAWARLRLQAWISVSRCLPTGRDAYLFCRRCCAPIWRLSRPAMRRNDWSRVVTTILVERYGSSLGDRLLQSRRLVLRSWQHCRCCTSRFIGPIDYLFVNRWLRKPWVAWVTFPPHCARILRRGHVAGCLAKMAAAGRLQIGWSWWISTRSRAKRAAHFGRLSTVRRRGSLISALNFRN